MKTASLTFVLLFVVLSCCKTQTPSTSNQDDVEKTSLVFDQMEVQGVDTRQPLLYGFFFFDKDQASLDKLKSHLVNLSYRFVNLEKKESGEFMLHVERVEKHTRLSLVKREDSLRILAAKFNVSSFDGFDVGNVNPAKPLTSNESFAAFMASKKGSDLFDLGIKLYNFEMNDKAELVFRECLKQNIKADTSAYKLGNILNNENKVQEGMGYLVKATQLNPRYLSAFFNLGAVCYDNGQYKQSIDYYEQANKLKPNDERIVYGIAASQYALGQFEKSLANCKKALQINENNDNAKQLLQMLSSKTH